MFDKYLLYVLVTTLMFISCSDDKSPVATGVTPEIEKVKLNDKWNPRLSQPYKVEVYVQDPQGPGNITKGLVQVRKENEEVILYTDSLYDDGAYFHPGDGDVIARDGVFCNRFSPNQILPVVETGLYSFSFYAIDNQGNESQMIDRLISFGTNSAPTISNIDAPDSYSALSDESSIRVTVNDSDGFMDIRKVYFESQLAGVNFARFESDLYNDGDPEHGDEVAGDSVYSIKLDSSFVVGKTGSYELLFYVEDSFNEQNDSIPIHTIFFTNLPPVYSELNMPDTVYIPAQPEENYLEYITMKVDDPEGLADILQVYFYSLKPDSSFGNGGNPIYLRDNGLPFSGTNNLAVGDQVAGDGIFTFGLPITSNMQTSSDTQLEAYFFTFYVADKAENLIGPFEKRFTVLESE